MKILHITPHMGGGVGTVITAWMEKVVGHDVMCLEKTKSRCTVPYVSWTDIANYDIVVVHYWDHPRLSIFFSQPLPPCRLVFWCHKNIVYPPEQVLYPDRWINTSPIQGNGYIWSTGNMDRFLGAKPVKHEGFNVGYVGTFDYKKMHLMFPQMCKSIDIPDIAFIIVGERKISAMDAEEDMAKISFVGKVDDVLPYLSIMDVFGYPLRPDHYGTCEQVLGEAMAMGVVPVVMYNPAEREIITDGIDGFIARDEMEYVGLVKFLYKYSAIRESMSVNARRTARKRYNIYNTVNEWDKVFDDMMGKPKKERGVL